MKKTFLTALALILIANSSFAQNEDTPTWLRYPAISPDGQTVVFGYMGNLYRVSIKGGTAMPLTVGDAHSECPVWSHDGKYIAYRSNLHSNFDVFMMPSEGGKSKRITYHSADDYPYDFTPDNKNILIGSLREAPASSVRFPGLRFFRSLYNYPVGGERPVLITAVGAENARYDNDGSKIVFQDKKGYEDEWRKHHTSSITRDIWMYDLKENSYKKLTNFKGEDRTPNFAPDGSSVYFTSEMSGDLNVYKLSLNGGQPTQLTKFKNFPVRSLTVAKNGQMAFEWKGDIYIYREGEQPQKLNIRILNNSGYNGIKEKTIRGLTEFAVSPNGKEIAYVARGEVFVSGIDNKITKRITNTPEQERMITWSPDAKILAFAGERHGRWSIYKVELDNSKEKYFHAATLLRTETLVNTNAEEFQPQFSPDGKKIAYVENRNILKVMDIKSGKTVTVLPEGRNFSYSDGDWDFAWSPDSRWLLVDDSKGYFTTSNTALIAADGKGDVVYPVNSGFGDGSAKWGMGGKLMTYKSTKLGRKSLAYQGSKESDIYAVFFDQEAYDEFTLSKDELGIKNDQKNEKEQKKEGKEEKEKEDDKKVEKLALNLENLQDRIVRLTINSASISDYVLTKDGSKLYYLAAFEKGYDLWVTEPRTRETKVLAKFGGSPSALELSKDEKSIFLNNKGTLVKVEVSSGKTENISISPKMTYNPERERAYIFDHTWRQVREKFYDPKIHGIDWEMYYKEYAKFLPHINNNYDFQVMLSEMLGELNASHTGARYYPTAENGDVTASFGLLFDETYMGEGIMITEVISGGPLDKAEYDLKPGDVITKINDIEVSANVNWNKYFNNLMDQNTLLTFKRKGKTFSYTIKPITLSSQNNLMYKRWIRKMEKMTDSLSGGRLGYVHVQGMNDGSFREVYENVMGRNRSKEALIVDTRFNGGGWLHNDLNTFLSGKEYLRFAPQGYLTKGGEPSDRWAKPSIVLISEGNYSDAFIFPYIYKQNKIGKLVGMPVAGTGTAVWWERQIDPTIVFGIPMVATIGDENRPTENLDLNPDILVDLPYNSFLNGEDAQLERAVKELMKEIK